MRIPVWQLTALPTTVATPPRCRNTSIVGISWRGWPSISRKSSNRRAKARHAFAPPEAVPEAAQTGHRPQRSEEHTSELQSLRHLVCRLLLEKKKKQVTK